MIYRLFAILALLFVSLASQAQGLTVPSDTSKKKKVKVLPLPIFGSSPETRFYFGAVGLFTINLFDDSISRISTGDIEINYTLNKQIITSANWFFYSRENKYIFVGNNSALKFPESFWGIGNTTADSSLEDYQAWRIEINDVALRKVYKDVYAGLSYRMQYVFDLKPFPGGLLDDQAVIGSRGGISSGLGLAMYWDRRDNVLYPSGGSSFLSINGTRFAKAFGSDFSFSKFEVDGRLYFKGYKDQVLAFQVYLNSNSGEVPFRMLGLLGGGTHGRGYYQGRYRDKHYFFTQGEYRFAIWRWVGMSVFAGAGDVSGEFSTLKFKDIKYSFGASLRLRVDKENRGWLRADYAIGRNGNRGFYLGYGESF